MQTRPRTIALAVRTRLGNTAPYRDAKAESTRRALALYPRLKDLVAKSEDPFDAVDLGAPVGGSIVRRSEIVGTMPA